MAPIPVQRFQAECAVGTPVLAEGPLRAHPQAQASLQAHPEAGVRHWRDPLALRHGVPTSPSSPMLT
eukprot:9705657-Karenia_brevis.AAC.1